MLMNAILPSACLGNLKLLIISTLCFKLYFKCLCGHCYFNSNLQETNSKLKTQDSFGSNICFPMCLK